VHAQTFKERMILMQNEYAQVKDVHILMSVTIFDNEKNSKPFFQQQAEIRKKDFQYNYSFGPISMLMTNDDMLMVDHSSKRIVCSKRSLEKEQKMFADPFKASLDSMLRLHGTPESIEKEKGIEHFRLKNDKGQIRQIDMFVNEANLLERLEYRYKEDQYVVIEFKIFNRTPEFAPETFNREQFVTMEKGKLKGAKNYSSFEVVTVEAQ
jgi:hypothetical protein